MNINIFITSCIWHRIKTKQVINSQKSWTINSSNNMNLVCKAFQYDPILFQRAKVWEGFGLTNNTSLLFGLGNPRTGFSAPLGLLFFFIFGGILTSLKHQEHHLDLNEVYKTFLKSSIIIVNATIHIKSQKLYVKPECFRHHKRKCLLQNQKKTLVLPFSNTFFLWIKTTHLDNKLFM